MQQSRRYLWSLTCSWALTGSVAALAVVGVLAVFLEASDDGSLRQFCAASFAAVVGLSIFNANNAANALMHALGRPRLPLAIAGPALALTVGFASASMLGVHLGWEILAAGPDGVNMPSSWIVVLASAFLACAKPAMSFVIEGRLTMDRAEVATLQAEEDARRVTAESLRVADRAPRRRRPVVVAGHDAARHHPAAMTEAAGPLRHDAAQDNCGDASNLPTTALADASSGVATTHRPRPRRASGPSPERRVDASEVETNASGIKAVARAKARQELLAGSERSNRAIAEEVGLSASTVDRIARDLEPLGGQRFRQ